MKIDLVLSDDSNYWIGLNDIVSEGNWVQVDESEPVWTKWDTDFP
jgi:hypothetical protein